MKSDGLRLAALAAALLFTSLATSHAAPEITWRDRYYNPKPSEGDLVLPVPAMADACFISPNMKSPTTSMPP